ncbi:MAG: hypothetical protein ACERKO_07360, partial [Acetanaerobacterium sp.]
GISVIMFTKFLFNACLAKKKGHSYAALPNFFFVQGARPLWYNPQRPCTLKPDLNMYSYNID